LGPFRIPHSQIRIFEQRLRRLIFLLLPNLAINASLSAAEKWTVEGFWENRGFLYAANSCSGCPHTEADSHLQTKIQYRFSKNIFVFEPNIWMDTRHQVRRNQASYSDRTDQRPVLSTNEFYLLIPLGSLDLRVGKQKIVWGRADGFNPTDNLTPFDYLDLMENERIGVTALRARQYWGSASLDMVWIPTFTPTRLPLLAQRWFPLRARDQARGVEVRSSVKYPATTPAHSQVALRWDDSRRGWDYSASYFSGWNDIPDYNIQFAVSSRSVQLDLARSFSRLQVIGADFAGVLGGRALRGEFGFFRPERKNNLPLINDRRNYIQYALGTDWRWGDWYAIAQWVGDNSLGTRSTFDIPGGPPRFPDRGFGQAVLGRVERTLNSWSSVHVNAVIRFQDADFLLKPEYLYDISQSWKLQAGFLILGGHRSGFLGQYHENSRMYIRLKQSF
jgi:hypothetical protein